MSGTLAGEAKITAIPTVVWGSFRRMEFTFEENPSTGYLWDVTSKPNDVIVDHMDFVCSEPDPAPHGTGGHRRFAVTTTHPCSVVFEMRRRWESKDIPPIRKVTVIVE